MRMVLMLVALLVIALLVAKQLDVEESAVQSTTMDDDVAADKVAPPKLPTRPGDVKEFEEDFNQFMSESEEKRDKLINNATQ